MNTRSAALPAALALSLLASPPATASPQLPTRLTDANPAGHANPDEITVVGSQVFFAADDGTNGRQPWVTDGSLAGSHMVKPILPSTWPLMMDYTAVNDLLLFKANDFVTGWELWRSDGTAVGTYPLTATHLLTSGGQVSKFHVFQDRFFFNSVGEMWESDGTLAGTAKFVQLLISGGGEPELGANVGNLMFFSVDDFSMLGREPYVTDGTPGGTHLVADVFPGSNTSTGVSGIGLGNVYFWMANDGTHGSELWRSDGSMAGTSLVKDIRPGPFGSNPRDLAVSGGKLFFSADDGTNGKELWVSDGSDPGTVMVKDILPGTGFAPDHIRQLTDVNGTLFFIASDSSSVERIWKSDGTLAGTVQVTPASVSIVDNLFAVGNAAFFSAYGSSVGKELWRSDGTPLGTVPVFDLAPGSGWSSPGEFAVGPDRIYFAATEPVFGREVYSLQLCEQQAPQAYCTAGTTASGCTANMSASGDPSASAGSGFVVSTSTAEGNKTGLFFFGTNGRQANAWGNGTSYQCVVPPVKRSPIQSSGGTNGNCDGTFSLDFNALITARPAKAPPTGSTVQIQCWFRDTFNTSNQSTSLSDGLEFTLCP